MKYFNDENKPIENKEGGDDRYISIPFNETDDNSERIHKMAALITKAKKITKVVVESEFEDDHLECFSAQLTIDGVICFVELFWMEPRIMFQSECCAKGKKELLSYLKDFAKEMV